MSFEFLGFPSSSTLISFQEFVSSNSSLSIVECMPTSNIANGLDDTIIDLEPFDEMGCDIDLLLFEEVPLASRGALSITQVVEYPPIQEEVTTVVQTNVVSANLQAPVFGNLVNRLTRVKRNYLSALKR